MGGIRQRFVRQSRQRGSSLIVTMIMLIVLMLMGVAGVVVSNTQFRMAGNLQFQNGAQNNSESALAQAEKYLSANILNAGFTTKTLPELYSTESGFPAPDALNSSWDDTNSRMVVVNGAPDPTQRYRIDMLTSTQTLASSGISSCMAYGGPGSCPNVRAFRVTTRGNSVRGSVKFVESIFVVPTL
jgi:Tfp pilus assembly protein PilX